jgi:hypothetical protein
MEDAVRAKKISIQVVTVLFLILIIGAQPVPTTLAASEGPLYPSTGTSVTAGEGTIAWIDPGNITADDNVEAQVDLAAGQISEYLQGTDFGFAIPTGATITGIEVTIGRSSSGSSGNPIEDHSVMLVKGGSLAGDNNAALGVKWPANHNEAARVYSPTDPLWGTSWTAEEINAADFGAAISVINPDSAARSGFVDYINISVSYLTPTSLAVSPIVGTYGENANFSATLTPAVADKTINFTLNGEVACSALTDVAGVATCQASLLADVGTYPSGVGASFAGDGDYGPSSNTGSVTINTRPASVTPKPASKAYGDADPTLTGTLTGFLAADGVSAVYSRTPGETVAGNPYTISAVLSPAEVLTNYDITYNTADFNITLKAASVTPDAAGKVYGDIDPTLSGALTGFVGTDEITANYSRTAGETVAGNPYVISATLNDPNGKLINYSITYNTADFTIAPKAASVTPDAASKVYGAADLALSGTLTGFLPADNVSAVYSREAGETVVDGPYEISAVLSPEGVLGNYDITYNTADFTITPIAAAVTPNAASKAYGAADPALSGTLTGFQVADGVSAVYSREAGETVAGGPYEISAVLSPAGVLGNYDIIYNTANFTITPIAASVTPNAASKVYGAADPTMSGTLTGFLVADGVSAVYNRTPGETVAGSPYTISGVLSPSGVLGNYTITYNTANFTITPKAASVTPNAASKVYGTADPALSGTLTGFLVADGVSAVYSRTPGETVAGSPYTISAVLSPAGVLGNYTITYNTANFTITLRAASVSAVPSSKAYGDLDPVLNATGSNFVAADLGEGKITFSASRQAGESVAGSPYLITPAASDNGTGLLDNYTVSYNPANFTVTKANPVCTVTPYTVEFDRLTHTATGSCAGVFEETLFGLDLSGTTHQAVGSYTLDPWVYTDVTGNYNNADGTVIDQITRRFITVTANNISKMIGKPDPWLTYLVTEGSLLAGDSFIGSLTREPGEAPGTYQILQGSLDLDYYNYYQLSFIGADFVIYGNQIFMPLIVH